MKRLTTLAVVVLLAFSGTFLASPKQNNGDKQFKPKHGIKAQLNLTEEQEKKFNEIIFSQREAMIDTRAEIQKLRLEKQKIAMSDNPDLTKLKKLNAKISELQTRGANSRLETWAKINKILTPEQQKIWKKTLNKLGKRMHHRKGCMRKRMGMRKRM